MKKQVIEYDKDEELGVDTQEQIMEVLKKENAENINIHFVDEPKEEKPEEEKENAT